MGTLFTIDGTTGNITTQGSVSAATITSTSGTISAAGSNTQLQFNNSGNLGAVSNLNWDGNRLNITRGAGGTIAALFTNGDVFIQGSGSPGLTLTDISGTGHVSIRPPSNIPSSYSVVMPNAQATVSGQALTNDASGNLSWTTVTTSPAGANTQIQFNNSGVFGASSSLTWNGTTLTAANLSLSNPLPVASGGTGTTTPSLVAGTNITITGTWPNQTINSSGASNSVASPTTTYNATSSDSLIFANATSAAFAVNLPSAASNSGKILYIKKTDSSANAVTVTRAGSDTIDGATTYPLTVQYAEVTIASNGGTSWYIL